MFTEGVFSDYITSVAEIEWEPLYNMYIGYRCLNNFFDLVIQGIDMCPDYCSGLSQKDLPFSYSTLIDYGFFDHLTEINNDCARCCDHQTENKQK